MAEHGVSPALEAAIERWQQAGIITDQQASAMRDLEAATGPRPAIREPAHEGGMTPSALITFIGGVLVLVASVVFVALGWEDMGRAQQLLWAVLAVAVPWGAAFYLRRTRHALALHAGAVLLAIGTVAILLLGYTTFRALGVWPDPWHFSDPDASSKQDRANRLMMVSQIVAALVAGLFAFRLRIPWMLLLTGVFGWFAWMTAIDQWVTPEDSRDPAFWTLAMYGVILVAVGLGVSRAGLRQHAFWLFFCGLTVTFVFFVADFVGNVLGPSGLLFLALAMIAIVLSMRSDYRIFLIYGALGLYTWVSALIIDTFGGSRPVAFALILLGAAIVLAGLAWQRRTSTRMHHRNGGGPAPAV